MTEGAIATLCYGVLGSNHIISLSMRHNTLGSDRIKGIATGLVANKVLQSLDLSFSDSIQLILPYLASSIDDNHTLNRLSLSNDRLTDISALTTSLKRSPSITRLDLASNYLDRSQASHIADMLRTNCTLEYLDLSSNVFGDHGAQLLSVALEQNVSLQTLKLENCSLLDLGVKSLGQALKFNCTLTCLSLAGNSVSDLACSSFVESLSTHRNEALTELNIDGPTPHMMQQLSELLMRNVAIARGDTPEMFPSTSSGKKSEAPNSTRFVAPTLSSSQLSSKTEIRWNSRFPLSLKTMNELFALGKGITNLNLIRCGISRLSESIATLSSLKLLDLRSNNLTSLCPEIARCTQLEVLKLSDNHLQSLPCELSQISSLVELHIYGNPLTFIPDSSNRVDGILDGPALDTSFAGMNVYRYHHVSFQQSLLMQYLRSAYLAQSQESDFMYGGISVVGPEKSGKTAFLNSLASQCTKRFKQWDAKHGPLMTFFNPGQSISPFYEEPANPEAIFDNNTNSCVQVGDFMLIHDEPGKKTPVWYHLTANDFSGLPSYKTLATYLIGEKETLYLVVFNLLEYPAKQGAIEDWIRTIVSRVGSSASIILVGTHAETKFAANKNAARETLVAIKKQFPVVSDVHFIDLKAKPEKVLKALTPICNSLVAIGRSKGSWNTRVPTSFVHSITQIWHMRDTLNLPMIPLAAFIENMRSAGVLASQMDSLIDKLTGIGLIRVWRHDHKLKSVVFLDTTFLYQALSEIVGPTATAKAPNGSVTRKALDTMWSPNTKPRMRPTVLKLLEMFEVIAIDYSRVEERLTIPYLLPAEPTSISSYWNPQVLGARLTQREWEMPYAPIGIGPKLVGAALALSHLEIVSLWFSGCVLRLGPELGKLEFKFENTSNTSSATISVQVMGDQTTMLLATALFRVVDQVVSAWLTEAEVKVFVPITLSSGTKRIPFEEVTAAAAKKTPTIAVGMENVNLVDLVPDIVLLDAQTPIPTPLLSKDLLARGELGNAYKATTRAKTNFSGLSLDSLSITPSTQNTPSGDSSALNTIFIKEAESASDLAFGEQEKGEAILGALVDLASQSRDAVRTTQLRNVSHVNLVPYSGITSTPHWASFSPFVENVSLSRFVTAASDAPLALKLKLLLDIAFAVEHLHRQSPAIFHGNLKPSNVIVQQQDNVDMDLVAKTTDFGLWPEIDAKSDGQERSAQWMWMAPEVFSGAPMSARSDSYSFGMLIWYVWTCHVTSMSTSAPNQANNDALINLERKIRLTPYYAYFPAYPQSVDLQHAIFRRHLRPRLPMDNRLVPGFQTLELLVRACWKPNAEERPDFSSIIKRLLQALDHVRDAANSPNGPSSSEPRTGNLSSAAKTRSIFSVNMKQLQYSRSWQLLASYIFKQQSHTFTSATSVSFKIPPTQLSSFRPASLIPPSESGTLSFLPNSTFWMGSSKNFVVLLDLKDGKTSIDLRLDPETPDRPTITFVPAAVVESKKPMTRSDSRGKRVPPPMMISGGSGSFSSSPSSSSATASAGTQRVGSPPNGTSSALSSSGGVARVGSPPNNSSPLSTSPPDSRNGSSPPPPATTSSTKSTNQRIIGSIVSGVAIWSFCEDKTLTISLGPKAISKVEIGRHPICVTKYGDFGYVGCGEGCILEIDLTRQPEPTAVTINAYLHRVLDVQGNPVYSIHVDDTNVWVGTKGEVIILDRLSSHKYFSWVAHTDRIVSILKMPDGKSVWTASDDRSIKVWPIRAIAQNPSAFEVISPNAPEKTLLHHNQRIKDMVLCGNNVFSIAGENTAMWDTITGTVTKVLPHTGFANAIAVLDSSTIVTISSSYDQKTTLHDTYVQVWHNGLDSPADPSSPSTGHRDPNCPSQNS